MFSMKKGANVTKYNDGHFDMQMRSNYALKYK